MVQGKQKTVSKATVQVQATRGLFVGMSGAELIEAEQRSTEGYDAPTRDLTESVDVRFPSTWSYPGRVRIEQRDPVPATVLAIIPEVSIGG